MAQIHIVTMVGPTFVMTATKGIANTFVNRYQLLYQSLAEE